MPGAPFRFNGIETGSGFSIRRVFLARTGPTWLENALVHCAAGPRRRLRAPRIGSRRGDCCRGGRDGRRGVAFIALPGLLGKSGLATHRDVFIAVGELGYDGTGDTGIGLGHQALQFGSAAGKVLPLGFKLLALVQIVFGGIGEGRRHAVAHFGAAAKPNAKRGQRHDNGGAQQRLQR